MDPTSLLHRYAVLVDRAQAIGAEQRLDLGDEAESLAVDARRWFDSTPTGRHHAAVAHVGDRASRLANMARARV